MVEYEPRCILDMFGNKHIPFGVEYVVAAKGRN